MQNSDQPVSAGNGIPPEAKGDLVGPGSFNMGLDHAIAEERYDNSPLLTRLRGYRTNVDGLYQTAVVFKKEKLVGEAMRYVHIAATSLQGARQFLGKILQEKGSAYPYTGNKASEVVDQGQPIEGFQQMPLYTQVTTFREKINDQITEMVIYIDQVSPVGPIDFVCQNAVLTKLLEARMALGEIFGEIAKTEEQQSTM
jgi:hypothetical protein